MPVLQRPRELTYIDLPARKAIDGGETDVLVVGGSFGGLGAAWAAAKAGAGVVLAEREGFLGGDATVSLVTIIMSYYTQHPKTGEALKARPSLFPSDYGDGRPAIGGFYTQLVERLVQAGGALRPSEETGFTLAIDPEIFKLVTFDLMNEAGVNLLLYATATDVIGRGGIEGVVFDTKSGPVAVRAGTVVDCTGDGDVAVMAGAPWELGRKEDGYAQPITLYFLMSGFNRDRFGEYVRRHPDQWHDVYGLWALLDRARESGDLDLQRENILMFGTPHDDVVVVDSTRVVKVSGVDAWDLTYAAVENFRQMRDLASFFKKFVPGFESSRILQSGPTLYVRESRRIMGDYLLSVQDVLGGRKFDDVVARGAYCVDIHSPVGSGTMVKHLPPGVIYDIPLRCLIPKNTENLLVADRCISGTHEAQASYRILPICMATGQAAGVCAALAARQRKQPREVDVREVQDILLRQKASLGEIAHALR